jgi:hypothetical protein
MSTQLWDCHVQWLWSAANGEVWAWCLPLGCVTFCLALGDLPGDPSGDIGTGRGRAGRVNLGVVRRRGVVDGGGLCRATVECSVEAAEGVVVILVGEVGAQLIWRLGVGEVEGVGLPASAHRYIGPFAVGVPGDPQATTQLSPATAHETEPSIARSTLRSGCATSKPISTAPNGPTLV